MSFFEKMMRINNAEHHTKWMDSSPNDEEPLRLSTLGEPDPRNSVKKGVMSSRILEEEMP
jgi:hypothetical protein